MNETYEIVRFFADDTPSCVIERGLTLDEAREWCRREDTHDMDATPAWFDGYREA